MLIMKKRGYIMAIKRVVMKVGEKPTAKQIAEVREASKRPISYDEDSPKLTKEEMSQFRRVKEIIKEQEAEKRKQTVTLRLKPQTIRKAKKLGKGYTSILAQVIEKVLADPAKLESLLEK